MMDYDKKDMDLDYAMEVMEEIEPDFESTISGTAERLILNAVKNAELVKVVYCKNCKHWIAPHVRMKDGRRRQYGGNEIDKLFGIHDVTSNVGINIRGQCDVDCNCGYADNKMVYRGAVDFCSNGEKRPCPYEKWWGIEDGFYPEGFLED